MTNDAIREHCLSLPHATEVVRWGDHLLFKVGGKMFAIIELDGHRCSLKCAPERYAELVEMEDIVPSGHNMWKHHWVTLEALSALPDREFRDLLTGSYDIVRGGLPKTVRAALDSASLPKTMRAALDSAGLRKTVRAALDAAGLPKTVRAALDAAPEPTPRTRRGGQGSALPARRRVKGGA